MLAPAGTAVEGRLTRVELRHAGAGEFTVALRWETMEIGGEMVPVNLKPSRQFGGLRDAASGLLMRRGTEFDLPRPGEQQDVIYHFPQQTTRVASGMRTVWVTTSGH